MASEPGREWRVKGGERDSERTFPFGCHPGGSTATDRIHFKRNAGNGFYHSLRSFQNDGKQKPLKSVALGVDARKGDLGLRNSERSPYLAPRRVGAPSAARRKQVAPRQKSRREKSLSAKGYLFFSKSRISVRRSSSFDGAGGATGASSCFRMFCINPRNFFITRNTTIATIRKSITPPIKLP